MGTPGVLLLLAVVGVCEGTTMRTIYTLFTSNKTWNEASAICESQYGELVKIQGPGDVEELRYLFNASTEWRSFNNTWMWTGLHAPFGNDTYKYQDCEVQSPSVSFNHTPAGNCSTFTFQSGFQLSKANCAEKGPFICQRNMGEDCWYEPFEMKNYSASSNIFQTVLLNGSLAENECAMECRTRKIGYVECWGFLFDQGYTSPCELLYLNSTTASSTFLTEPMTDANYDAEFIFYKRRCFEGNADSKTYSSFSNSNPLPATDCDTKVYVETNTSAQICFCSTQDHPLIPEPISSEAKALKYAEELAIDNSNTSSAKLKLECAEDNRPSAIGVGLVGVGLITAVFGGLVLLDLNVLIAGIKELLCSSSEVKTESDC